MSLLFSESFDLYTNPSQVFSNVVGSPAINATAARTGPQGLYCVANGVAVGNALPSNLATCIMGFACQFTSSMNVAMLQFSDTGTYQLGFQLTSAGQISVWRGQAGAGTLLGTTSGIPLAANVWNYIEVKFTIASGTGGSVYVNINGVNALTLTGQNTQISSNAWVNTYVLGPNGSVSGSIFVYIDDVYICSNAGSRNNDFLGDVAVLAKSPNGNGATNNYTNSFAAWAASTVMSVGQQIKDSNNNVQRVQSVTSDAKTGGSAPAWATTGGNTTTDNHVTWVVVGTGANPGVANWMAVSEVPPDDNNSYVTDATVSDIDLYAYPSVSGSSVKAVVVKVRAEKDDSGTRTIRTEVRSSGTNYDDGVDKALTLNTYGDFQGIWETDPATAVAWTVAGVNAAQFGIKTTA